MLASWPDETGDGEAKGAPTRSDRRRGRGRLALAALALAVTGVSVAATRSAGQLPGPPVAVTGEASELRVDRATLAGTVNPNGAATSYRFDYGPGPGYGSSTPSRSLPPGFEPVPVEEPVSGLEPGRSYHYRLVATSDQGTSSGDDRTFTTLDPQLKGKFGVRVRVTGGGGPFHQHRGDHARRSYRFQARCRPARCPEVVLEREGQSGRFRSTLERRGAGLYRGFERFREGRCDNGLGFRSRSRFQIRVSGLSGDRASRVKGRLATRVRGCVSGRERARLRGRLRR